MSADTWTLTEQPLGFDLRIRPLPRARRRVLGSAAVVGVAAAVVVTLVDIARARGLPVGPFLAGSAGGIAGTFVQRLKRIWVQSESLTVNESRLSHTWPGPRGPETRSIHLGPEVEVEAEPAHLADGLPALSPRGRPALIVHSAGRSIAVGHGLRGEDAARLHAEIDRRLAPDRRPVAGRPGAVRPVLFPVETGGERQRRYVGRQRSPPIGTEGILRSIVLLTSCLTVLVAVPIVLVGLATDGAGELSVSAAAFGLAGATMLSPSIGLLDRWRRRELAAARDAVTGRPAEPWTWHGRWTGGRVRRTALFRLTHTSAAFGLPVVGGLILWGGAPRTPLLIPVWVAIAALALVPMTVYLWQLAFAGTTELRVPEIPLVPGSRVDLRFALDRDASPFSSIAFRLLRTELRRAGLMQGRHYWTTHEGVYHLPPDTPPPGPNEEVSALFDVPADAGGTDEEADPAVRWFLEVRGVTSAGPYIEAFPVPVFDRPGAP